SRCNPSEGLVCQDPTFGDGLCDHTSWDDPSVGKCFETCNPIAQDCHSPELGCYAVKDVEQPICYQNWGFKEGESCNRLTHCAAGLPCQCRRGDRGKCAGGENRECRKYCMPGCDGQCPADRTCVQIAGWPYGACLPG